MGIFKKQPLFCCICGKEFQTNFTTWHGYICSEPCWDEFQWRKTLYIMGEEYHKKPIKNKTPEESKKFLIDAGILNSDGSLTSPYNGECCKDLPEEEKCRRCKNCLVIGE